MLLLLKQAVFGCGIAFSALAGLMTSAHTAVQNETGLTGILAPEIPEGLMVEDFEVLGPNWSEWSQATAAEIEKLYGEDPLSVDEQRSLLESLASRERVMETALGDASYGMIHKPLAALHGKLNRRLDIAKAVLETLELDPEAARRAQIDGALQNVLTAQSKLAGHLAAFKGGPAWLNYLGAGDLSQKVADRDSDAVLQTLSAIAERIAERGSLATPEQQEFLGTAPFLNLAEAIDGYRSATQLPVDTGDNEQLRAALTDLVASLEAYEMMNQSTHAQGARAAYESICKLSPDGGQLITNAMRAHYFNYNIHVTASEAFLDRLAAEERFEDGPVDDFIMGAKVKGTQRTRVLTGIDILPSRNGLRFNVVANGHICSNTQGVTDQATVYTAGNHSFTVTKEVLFDWNQFTPQPALIGVNANNHTYDASTPLDGIPLLSAIGKSIAKSEARKRRPQSQAIARGRISSRVLPRFNSEGDEGFVKATTELNDKFYANLKEANIYPSAYGLSSTDDAIFIDTRTMEAGELAGSRPNRLAASSTGATVEVHETAINNMFDRIGIAGKSLTEKETETLFKAYFEKAFGTKFEELESSEKSYEEDLTELIFAEQDPLRVRFEGEQVILTIRAGLKPEDEEEIPTQEISVGLTFQIEGDLIIVEAGDISVSPVEKPASLQIQIARAGVIRQKIAQALPRREIDGKFDFKHKDSDRVVDMNVRDLEFLNGWMRTVIE